MATKSTNKKRMKDSLEAKDRECRVEVEEVYSHLKKPKKPREMPTEW